MTSTRFIPLLLLLGALATAGCTDPAEPDTPSGVAEGGKLAVTQLADLPHSGGNVSDVAITSNSTVVAVIDGKLYSMPEAGGVPTLLNGDAEYTQVMTTPTGELYALTTTDLRAFDNIGATPRITSLDVGNRFVEGVRIAVSPSGTPFVAINSYPAGMAVYTTSDRGATWNRVAMPQGATSLTYGTGLAFTPSGDLLVTNSQGLYRSGDGGTTWSTLTTDMSTFGSGFQIFVASNGDIYRYMTAVGNLGVSRDGGTSFTSITPYNRPPLILDLREGANGLLYAITLAGELLRSTDRGATWQVEILCGSCKTIDTRGSTVIIGLGTNGGGEGGLMLSQNSGDRWSSAGLSRATNIQDIGFDRSGGLMLLADNALYRTTASGWELLGRHGAYQRFASAPAGELMVGGLDGVYHSTDNGTSWRHDTLQAPPFGGSNDNPALLVLLGRRNGGFILSSGYVNLQTGIPSNTYLFDTDPSGKPRRINSPGPVGRVVEDLAGTLYTSVTYEDAITQQYYSEAYQSNDGGTTWQKLAQNVSGQPAGALAFNSANGYLSLGGTTGLRFSKVTQNTPTELTLTGGASQPYYIVRAWFGPDDRLYLLTRNQGLLISQSPLK